MRIQLASEEKKIIFSCANKVEHAEQIDIDRVFERFYKADSARANSSTGLGLSIAHSLAEKMGAVMRASLEEDRFMITVVFDRAEEERMTV